MKRVTIFSPELKDREEIGVAVENYFKNEFRNYSKELEIQKYYSLNEPLTENQIGHHYEILVIFDRRLCPKENRYEHARNTFRFKLLNNVLELTKNVCDEKNIPYITYEGELTKKQELNLINKIVGKKEKIKQRLEEL